MTNHHSVANKCMIAEMAELTANNNHTEAYILGCRVIGDAADELKEEFQAILKQRDRMGYLTCEASARSYQAFCRLKTLAKEKLGHRFPEFILTL